MIEKKVKKGNIKQLLVIFPTHFVTSKNTANASQDTLNDIVFSPVLFVQQSL